MPLITTSSTKFWSTASTKLFCSKSNYLVFLSVKPFPYKNSVILIEQTWFATEVPYIKLLKPARSSWHSLRRNLWIPATYTFSVPQSPLTTTGAPYRDKDDKTQNQLMNKRNHKKYGLTDAKLTSDLFHTFHKVVTNNTWVIVSVCHFKP